MARLLAIDWDGKEARYVVATAHGARLKFEAAGTLPIDSDSEADGSPAQLGAALRSALAGKLGRATAIVGVDRSQIELVSLTLPPASDAELPELVRNQAMRENSAIVDDTVVDFAAIEESGDGPRKVTAVALSSSRLQRIQSVLSEAAVSPKAVVLRPYATVGLVFDALPDREGACVVINVLADEIDLIVLSKGQVVFWRTLRQPNASRDGAAARRLLGEIQRTLMVAQSHLSGQTIQTAYLCGGLDEHPALVEVLRADLPLELTLVDPFSTQGDFSDRPDNPGRFASLVGMLMIEARGGAHTIDFLHPRKRPTPPDRRRTLALAGAAVALIALLGGYRAWSTFSEADGEIEILSARLDELDDQFKRAKGRQKVIQAVGDWSKSDVIWLDELRDLSLRFPGGRDAVVLRMGLSQSGDAAGTIDMVGIVRDPVIVSHIENNLRDDYHQISSRHMQQRLQNNNYSWHFESSMIVEPREPGQYVSHLPEGAQAIEKARGKVSRVLEPVPPRPAAQGGKQRE